MNKLHQQDSLQVLQKLSSNEKVQFQENGNMKRAGSSKNNDIKQIIFSLGMHLLSFLTLAYDRQSCMRFDRMISSYFILCLQNYLLQSENISMSSNIFMSTFSRFKMHQPIFELAQESKKELNIGVFKNIPLRVNDIVQKYQLLEKKYSRANCKQIAMEWKEDEKKILFCFLLAFCHMNFKKVSEISNREWMDISQAFHGKNILLMKYEAKTIERNSERVQWGENEQLLLQKHIRNGMMGKWADISRCLFFESQGEYYKTPKQCREHWFNHMNKTIKHGQWQVQQDLVILQSALDYGHKWARVVDLLDGKRTEHMIKNRFHSLLTCCNRLIDNESQQKNEGKLIKILINQLHHKKQYPRNDSEPSSDLAQGQCRISQTAVHKVINENIKKEQQIQYVKPGIRSDDAQPKRMEESQLKKKSKEQGHIENFTKIKNQLLKKQEEYNPFPFFYQISNGYYPQPMLTPIILSPIYPNIQLYYHHI